MLQNARVRLGVASIVAGLALAPAAPAVAAIKQYAINVGNGFQVHGALDLSPDGTPTILTAMLHDTSSTQTTPTPLLGEGAQLVTMTATKLTRAAFALVLEPEDSELIPEGLVDSFGLLQFDAVESKYYSSHWAPVTDPLEYILNPASTLGFCMTFDPEDPDVHEVPLPCDLDLFVLEGPEGTLEGFVFLEGADGCWHLSYAPLTMGPQFDILLGDPVIMP
ncbi:MAG: hypothetical protein SGJ11_01605 [Phycisphaerae bacterium]|nr:hypothetical protein [Phycisphaerae bacterium]